MDPTIVELDATISSARVEALSAILSESVNAGAAIGFMAPLSPSDAAAFWLEDVLPQVAQGKRHLFAAEQAGEIVGTVQLITATPQNQPHRCDVAKMIVHPSARRLGIGRRLMTHAIARAGTLGRTLITLDTRTGDAAEPLYRSLGFQVAGTIPDYAFDADGKALHATTYMYLLLRAESRNR